jgi:protein-S-isoprenylcysteine O-methyltransferase Ste14
MPLSLANATSEPRAVLEGPALDVTVFDATLDANVVSTGARPVDRKRRFRWRGAFAIVLLGPTALAALVGRSLVDPHSWLAVALDACGWAAFVAGAGLRFWATLYIGGRKNDVVVAEGPYSLCRHPLYLGSLLLALAGVFFLKSAVVGLALALVATAYARFTVPAEEEYLAARLGHPYWEYCQRVNRFWPSWGGLRTSARLTIDVHSLYLESARASRWMWLPILAAILAHARTAPWWPRLFDLP